jgi:biopolymer transport protein TolR
MARNFRRQRASHPIADLNVTNLIDLGFILLIIFMIATPLIQQEQTIPVKLPGESKSPQQKADPKTKYHAVSIDVQGRFYLDNDTTPLTLSVLKSRLAAYAKDKDNVVVRIRGDEEVRYGKIIQVMDELKKLDLTSVMFDTQVNP